MSATTKSELVKRLVENGLTKAQARRAVAAFINGITDALAEGERVTLKGLGSFEVRVRPFHWRQLPREREIVRVPERTLVRFRPGAALKQAADRSPDDPYFDAIIARRRANSRQLLSQPEQNPAVHDTQFDMGIAYREMGLFEQALLKFQQALSLLDQRERGARYVLCCYMLGLCYVDLGELEGAEEWFRAGLAAPRRPLAERIELHYQLGRAYESHGQARQALRELLQVFITNPRFRDVAERVKALKEARRAQSAS
jgi:nucleoid DNA-binding protein